MLSDVDQLVRENESIKESTHPSRLDFGNLKWFSLSIFYILGVAGAISYLQYSGRLAFRPVYLTLLVPGILLLAYFEAKRHFVTYHFTTDKIIKERGILNKKTTTVDYDKITDVSLDKDLQDRVFDVGDIRINTAGTHKSEQILNGVKDPESYRIIISESKDSQNSTGEETDEFSDDEEKK